MSLRTTVLLLCGLLSGLALWATTDLAEPPANEGTTPEPFPFSNRYPAEVVLDSPQDLAVLVRLEIDVGQVCPVDETRPFPGLDEPFEPLLATVYINDGEAERLGEEGLAAHAIPPESVQAWRAYGPGTEALEPWPTFEDLVSRLQPIADNYPDIVLMLSIGQSVQGRELWMLKICDNPDVDEDEPEFEYVSTMHGNEPLGIEITLRLADLLTANYGVDPGLTEGQDIGYDIGSSQFYADYLHADYHTDDANSHDLAGLDYLTGVDVTTEGGDGADNQDHPSDVTPIGGAVAVMDYLSQGLYGGVAYQDDTYGVVYFSFGFEAINNQPDRTEVMSRTLSWLGGCLSPDYSVYLPIIRR